MYLYQSKLTMNPPQSTAGWGWHQDFWPWHDRDSVPAPNLFSAIVFLDDVEENTGGIAVVSGSHKLGLNDFEARRQLVADLEANGDDDSRAICPVGPAGSVLLFHALSTHGSAANRSERQRRLLILTYNSCLNPPSRFSSAEWLCARDLTPCAAASG